MDTFIELLEMYSPIAVSFPNLVWGGVFLLIGIFTLYSALLLYHWLRYGEGEAAIFLGMILYFSVSALLIVSMFGSATVLL
jgi:asparagine N-glycosylation enzyme membrane subunit Stt3